MREGSIVFDFLKNRKQDVVKADPVYAEKLMTQAEDLVEKEDMKKA